MKHLHLYIKIEIKLLPVAAMRQQWQWIRINNVPIIDLFKQSNTISNIILFYTVALFYKYKN